MKRTDYTPNTDWISDDLKPGPGAAMPLEIPFDYSQLYGFSAEDIADLESSGNQEDNVAE